MARQFRLRSIGRALPKPDTSNVGGSSGGPPYVGIASTSGSYASFTLPEYNPKLRGQAGILTYDEMRRSSAHVRASLRMVKAPILGANWYMSPATDRPIDREKAEFTWWALHHMNTGLKQRTFVSFIREALSSLDFGYYMFEKWWDYTTWTPEPNDDRPKPRSRPVVTLRDLAPRHPRRVTQFSWDENGQLDYVWWGLKTVKIEMKKIVHLAFDEEADDPTGMSVLRSAYQPWYFLQNLYRVDGIQKERHGIGIPHIGLPVGFTPDDNKAAREMGRNLRVNEMAYIVTPPNWTVDFVKPQGQMVDVMASAQHHVLAILQNVLAQFLALGTQESGSRAVSSSQVDAFMQALRFVADFIRGVINTQIVPELLDYNYEPDLYPELMVRHLGEADLARQLSVTLKNFIEVGAITPDADLETILRIILQLPKPTADILSRSIEDRIGPLPERFQVREDIKAVASNEPAAVEESSEEGALPENTSVKEAVKKDVGSVGA